MRNGMNNSMETISAAATAIVTAEARVQQPTVQKRRWGSWLSGYWCFGSHRNGKRIGHAILAPEPSASGAVAPITESSTRTTTVALPFVAPPSSPASFLQSEPHSSAQSPGGLLSFTNFSSNVYSSPGPNSIFAIGPYAHETQLVSPPVFSNFTTEPNTAPFTPPPESVHMTTPSSPEVPFAKLLTSLDPNNRNNDRRFQPSHYEFQSYQLYPGSPVNHLISPGSVISNSGTSSPFPDSELNPGGRTYLEFRTGDPPKLWNINGFSTYKWGTRQGSGSLTPDATGPTFPQDFSTYKWGTRQSSGSLTPDATGPAYPPDFSTYKWGTRQSSGSLTPATGPTTPPDNFLLESQISEVASLANSDNGSEISCMTINHRVSFELNAGDVAACLEKKPLACIEAISESMPPVTIIEATTNRKDGHPREVENASEGFVGEASSVDNNESQCRVEPSLTTVGSVKEFKFDNTDGGTSDKPSVNSDWWANENVVAKEAGPHKNWSFFPMIHPGVS